MAIPMGFAESYPNRPTAYELEGLVILGKECVLGVNERCYATQTSTNPTYSVSPPFVKTNSAGWYLDQSTMGTVASTARSLVTYYANPDTVYDGTTNITMLTVAEVWEELGIGDHSNQFTQVFASGTNTAVYGDSPWRIYEENLEERYKVLNALKMTTKAGKTINNKIITAQGIAETWDNLKSIVENSWTANPATTNIGGIMYQYTAGGETAGGRFDGHMASGELREDTNNITADITYQVSFYIFPIIPTVYGSGADAYREFYDGGLGLTSNIWNLVGMPFSSVLTMPQWCDAPPGASLGRTKGFFATSKGFYIWNFQYCE